MANLTLQDIRNKMNRSRRNVLNDATALRQQKLIRFCNDNDAFNWACRFYRYNHIAYHGNVDSIHSDTFGQMYTIITDKYNYDIAHDELTNDLMSTDNRDPSVKEIKYLIDTMATLRRKYKKN